MSAYTDIPVRKPVVNGAEKETVSKRFPKLSHLVEEFALLSSEYEHLESALFHERTERVQAQKALDELRKKWNEYTHETSHKVQQQADAIEAWKQRESALLSQVQEHKNLENSLREQMIRHSSEMNQLKAYLSRLKESYKVSQKKYQEILDQAKVDYSQLRSHFEKAGKESQAKDAQISSLESQLKEWGYRGQYWANQKAHWIESKAAWEAEKKEIKLEEKARMEKALAQWEAERNQASLEFEKKVSVLDGKLVEQSRTLSKLDKDLEVARSTLLSEKQNYEALKKDLLEAETNRIQAAEREKKQEFEINRLRAELEIQTKRGLEASNYLELYQEELEKFKKRLAENADSEMDLKKKVDQLKEACTESERTLQAKDAQIARLSQEVKRLQRSYPIRDLLKVKESQIEKAFAERDRCVKDGIAATSLNSLISLLIDQRDQLRQLAADEKF